eukprot:13057243-Ditylum_brightwellii.AAC.1
MANIKSDADPASETSKRHHFELATTYLQPFCPVLKKFPSGTKCDAIEISDVRHHFELAATYLQPFCSVLKKFPSGTKRDAIKISD